MPLREQNSSALLISLAAVALALLAGAVIALSGGGGGNAATLDWTPPAPTPLPPTPMAQAPIAAQLPTAMLLAPTLAPTATAQPSATATRRQPTATLTPAPTFTVQPETPQTSNARIIAAPANLRAGPGADFGVVAVAAEGATYEATGRTEDNAWIRLCCVDNAPVWVAAELVQLPEGWAAPVAE